ncbi:MAG TPA: phosphoenolpyruvate carboxylase [Sphingobacteriaceae bacterium]
MKSTQKEAIFSNEVLLRFDLYNSLFQTLPFYKVRQTGVLLPFFTSYCEEGVQQEQAPTAIIEGFLASYGNYVTATDRFDLLFHFIQYIERQVVLFDAIEDSSFKKLHTEEAGSLQAILLRAGSEPGYRQEITEALKRFSLRIVLTAHPTQFYPGPVLGIMNDLNRALQKNDLDSINVLLQQLGKTPFFSKTKPTPVDEARSLAWFMENVFYQSSARLQSLVSSAFNLPDQDFNLIELGFWPGGDRDGNPNVTSESTRSVARMLRTILFRCYYRDFRLLKRRITFRGVEESMNNLQELFYQNSFNDLQAPVDHKEEILDNLQAIRDVLMSWHNGLFVELVDDLRMKVRLFGNYFASLDIRQDSRILRKAYRFGLQQLGLSETPEAYQDLQEARKLELISFEEHDLEPVAATDDLVRDTFETIRLMQDIQRAGGEKAAHRFIISNAQEATDILQLMNLFLWSGWKMEALTIDFVPLFETVTDLERAGRVMEILYSHPVYRDHLARRGKKQIIMLGFSDSTKDGGYLMANWSIFLAKTGLTAIAREYDIDLTFFDGRGGPPARGGGKTHRFYASMGRDIANSSIQLTIQGQTISSQYGSSETAYHNLEQLINAGLTSSLEMRGMDTMEPDEADVFRQLADRSYEAFLALRQQPLFLKYLEKLSPLKLLAEMNISSRPVKRSGDKELKLEDLRAISFVTSWSQLKQNIPGFYGVGTALKHAREHGYWEQVKQMYQDNIQFRTIMDNCMMSMSKSDFRVTAYLENDPEFSGFWKNLKEEFELTRSLLLELSGQTGLMENYPIEKQSIGTREKIVLPLVLIQHYAIEKLNADPAGELADTYKKLIIRTVYGIVNAGRNVA